MSAATTFTCDHCGGKGLGIPSERYNYQEPPWGWTWYWGASTKGPHGCSKDCWDAIQEAHRAETGKIYLPDSHERRAESKEEARLKQAEWQVRQQPVFPPKPKSKPHSRVYFIQRGDSGPVKIGTSRGVQARLRQLQTSAPEALRVLTDAPGGPEDEAHLHVRFASHRMSGEWFQAAPEILDYVGAVAQRGAL